MILGREEGPIGCEIQGSIVHQFKRSLKMAFQLSVNDVSIASIPVVEHVEGELRVQLYFSDRILGQSVPVQIVD